MRKIFDSANSMNKSWLTKDFVCIFAAIIENVCGFCEVYGKPEYDPLVFVFLERLKSSASSLWDDIQGHQRSFGCNDLPPLLYLGWLAARMSRRIKKKANSKRAVTLLLLNAMRKAHVAQHEAWGENEWSGDIPPVDIINTRLVTGICVREYQEILARTDGYGRSQNGLSTMYKVLTDFLQVRKDVKLFPDLSRKLNPDPYAAYLWELPKRTCPRCGRQSYPTIAHDKSFHIIHGFHFQCQFCGHPYGPGGLIKSLRNDGRRISSTVWTTGRFEMEECEFCGRSRKMIEALGMHLESHHIRPVCENGPDIPSNIMLLCSECHAEAHKRRKKFRDE